MSSLDLSAMRVHDLMEREWLVTNSLGGYASSSVPGINTRKYHGLLVAAMTPPLKRTVILSRVEDTVQVGSRTFPLSSCEYPGAIHPAGYQYLRAFSTNLFPRWAYQGEDWTIEKNLRLVPGENTVILTYTVLTASRPIDIEVKPLLALRGIHELMYQWNSRMEASALDRGQHNLVVPATAKTPEVYLSHDGAYRAQTNWYLATIYRREIERGYSGLEDVWTPGAIRWTLEPGKSGHLACSTGPIDLEDLLYSLNANPHVSRSLSISVPDGSVTDEVRKSNEEIQTLVNAASEFVVKDSNHRSALMARYPWSPILTRDSLIGLPGTLLVTRRFTEAKQVLDTFFANLKDGLLPSSFPEDGTAPIYTAADTSLWLIHAADQYLRYSADHLAMQQWFEPSLKVIASYQAGTGLGINCDIDGLIFARAPGIPTTWMDAKCADWVITPRHGRAVEIQALWYNALRILANWSELLGDAKRSGDFARIAMRAKAAFNERFWNVDTRCLFDVVLEKGSDACVRPNQLLAISLTYPILAPERHATVLERVRQSLLTPMGMRTLSPEDPSYQGRYVGDTVSRDRAYHQGSAFVWLLGPYITAMVKTYGSSDSVIRQARDVLAGVIRYMQAEGVGQCCELFDGDPPHRPSGAIASVAATGEILRAYVEDILDYKPGTQKKLVPSPTKNR